MELTKDTPTHEITIKGVQLIVPAPFAEGHVLRANEASVLNQTLAENLRNNFAGTVKSAIEQAGSIEQLDLKDLQKQLNVYVGEYDFGVRRSGGGGPKLEPRVRIARDIAKEKIKEAIRGKGLKVSAYSAEDINSKALELVEKDSFYLAEADRRLKAQQKAAAESIDLSELVKAEPKAAAA